MVCLCACACASCYGTFLLYCYNCTCQHCLVAALVAVAVAVGLDKSDTNDTRSMFSSWDSKVVVRIDMKSSR